MTFGRIEVAEHRGHEIRFQYLLLPFDSYSGRSEFHIHAALVGSAALARHVPTALQPIHGQRHCRSGYPHVAGKAEERSTFHVVEMIQDTCLMCAEYGCRLFIPDMAAMAREVDLGITPENDVDVFVRH